MAEQWERRRKYQRDWVRAKRARIRLEFKTQQSSSDDYYSDGGGDDVQLQLRADVEDSSSTEEGNVRDVLSRSFPVNGEISSQMIVTGLLQSPPAYEESQQALDDVDMMPGNCDSDEDVAGKTELFKTGLAHWVSICNQY